MSVKCPKCHSENPETKQFCADCGTNLVRHFSDIQLKATETLQVPIQELARGTTLAGRYEIIEELGKGGMGNVYRVEDNKIKAEIALKLIKPEIAADKQTIERFRNELKTARMISHRNVCRMFDLGEEKGICFITMEYVSGEDLKSFIHRVGQLPVGKAISISKQVCEGLAEAHRLGVVHRDLKPSNIMIDKDGNARIMDFGIARSLKGKGITGAGVMIGTPEYMSPEQVEGKDVDQSSDIYSLGVILYEMVIGRVPFEGDTPFSIAMKHKSEIPHDPRELNPQIPEEFSQVILRCMEKGKSKRFQNAEEVLSELNKIEKGIIIPDRATPKIKPITSKEAKIKFRLKSVFIPALGIIIISAAAIYFLSRGRRDVIEIRVGNTKQITYEPGLEMDPSISPDGKTLAFVKGPVGKMQLYVRQVMGGRAVALAENFPGNQRWPQWSPDGTQIVFQSEGAIYVVPAFGGIPKRLFENLTNDSAYSASWSPDGKKIAYAQRKSIYIFSLDAGKSEKLVEADEPHSLSWSPDESRIAYVSGNLSFIFSKTDVPEAFYPVIGNIAPSSIHVASTSKGTTVQVTDNKYLNTSPVWTPDGHHLIFVSNLGGSRDIYMVPLNLSSKPSGPPVRLTTGSDAQSISISKDGHELAYSVFDLTANVWGIRIPEKEVLSVSNAQPLTSGNQIVENFDISHDSQWLVFDSNLSGNMDIYKMSLSGGGIVQLTTLESDDFIPCWSPDGMEIVFHSFRTGNRDIFVMTKDGESVQQVTDDPAQDRCPDWSPDGAKIVFFSDKTGRNELYVSSRKNQGWDIPRQITYDGGMYPRWSPVGSSIAYIAKSSLKLISSDGKDSKTLVQGQDPDGLPNPTFPAWSLDGQKIYYIASDDVGNSGIWSVPAFGGEPNHLVSFDNPLMPYHSCFATDGKQFFFSLRTSESNLWALDLVIGKSSELR